MPKTVLLTGAGGFLAGHFATAFAAAGWQVIGVGRSDPLGQAASFSTFRLQDLGDLGRFTSLLTREAPAVLVHLAAPASVPGSLREPLADLLAHLIPTANVLEAVRRSRVEARVILVSSAAVYGNPTTLPVPETAALAPISPYGFHKVQQELVVDQYVALHGLRACKARVFSTYGENLRRLAVWEVAQRALAGKDQVFGTGEESRDYLDAVEVAKAIVCIAERAEFRGEAINVASGEEVAIRTLAAEIFRLAGAGGSPRFTGESLAGSPIRWRADIARLRQLGYPLQASWSSGLERTMQWIKAQGPSRP
jgi:UDP-glucose 4-epimerase